MKNFLAFDRGASSGRGIIGKLENGKLPLKAGTYKIEARK